MGYELHIKRVSEAGHEGGARISREEWEEAVASESNLRIDSTATVVRNPRTGETISVSAGEADVAVLIPARGILKLLGIDGRWVRVFRFSRGRATFRGSAALESPGHPVRKAAASLASRLGAAIVGDDGERYDW